MSDLYSSPVGNHSNTDRMLAEAVVAIILLAPKDVREEIFDIVGGLRGWWGDYTWSRSQSAIEKRVKLNRAALNLERARREHTVAVAEAERELEAKS